MDLISPLLAVRLFNGRGFPTTGCTPEPLDKIDLFHLGSQGIFRKAAPLYASGRSLREIAQELGVCKTTIRKALLDGGVDLRAPTGRPERNPSHVEHRHTGVAPYGYCVVDGRLLADPREQANVQLVQRLRSAGASLNAVAKHFNKQKIKARKGGRWDHSIIRSIVERHQTKINQSRSKK